MITKEKNIKKLKYRLKLGIVAGFILLIYGLLRMIFLSPNVAINLKTQLPIMINGTMAIVIGLCLIIGCTLSLRKQSINKEIEFLEKETKEKRKENLGLKHY